MALTVTLSVAMALSIGLVAVSICAATIERWPTVVVCLVALLFALFAVLLQLL